MPGTTDKGKGTDPGTVTGTKILLVDDDAAVRLSFRSFLEDDGFRVTAAQDGMEGLERFRAETPDLAIVDLRMPRMDGLDLLRSIRQTDTEIPVIVVSGAGTMSDSIEALRLGAWDYLVKPVPDLMVLRHAVDQALERARLRRENARYRDRLEALVRERTRELERRIRETREVADRLRIFSLALEQSVNAVIITDVEGRIEYVNRRFTELTGYSRDEVLNHTPRMLKSDLTPAATYRRMWRTIAAGRPWRGELMNRRKSGEAYWEELTITPILGDDGRVAHYLAMQEDISARKTREALLIHQASHDGLTGLPNRILAIDRLGEAVRRSLRQQEQGALLFIDLDDFKQINDTHGHETGDRLLKAVATRLKETVRHSDTVARIGGDEFIVILQWVEEGDGLRSTVEKIRRCLSLPLRLDGTEVVVTASIGVVVFPRHGDDSGELVRRADTAMYSAKQWGRDRIVLYDDLLTQGGCGGEI